MSARVWCLAGLGSSVLPLATMSCDGSTDLSNPVVRFRMESATCGGPITFQFSIDEQVVGTEALRDRETSTGFTTTAGEHAVRAAIVSGALVNHSTVTLRPGASETIILSPYCS